MLAKTQLEVPTLGDKKPRPRWEIDRHVPIALIITLLVQGAGIVWWAAQISDRVTHIEKRIEETKPHTERLTRVETKVDGIADTLVEIKTAVQTRVTAAVTKKPLSR